MLSKAHREILNKIIADINDMEIKTLLSDYVCLHNVVIAMYGRNVFCFSGQWLKMKRSYDFNYDYVRENNTSYKLTEIEKKIRNYCNRFIENNDNITIYLDEFIDYIKYALYEMINDIILPIKILSPKIKDIMNKYKDFKYYKKSKKLNYEVLAQLNL